MQWQQMYQLYRSDLVPTLCCICLGRCCLGLETRVIIKILKNPCKPINFDMFSWEWSKKIQNGRLKKTEFFNLVKSWAISAKISWIGPWVSRIDWCEGHQCDSTYMVVRLLDISSKTGKKCIFCVFRPFLSLCRTASPPHRLSYINALCINQY